MILILFEFYSLWKPSGEGINIFAGIWSHEIIASMDFKIRLLKDRYPQSLLWRTCTYHFSICHCWKEVINNYLSPYSIYKQFNNIFSTRIYNRYSLIILRKYFGWNYAILILSSHLIVSQACERWNNTTIAYLMLLHLITYNLSGHLNLGAWNVYLSWPSPSG